MLSGQAVKGFAAGARARGANKLRELRGDLRYLASVVTLVPAAGALFAGLLLANTTIDGQPVTRTGMIVSVHDGGLALDEYRNAAGQYCYVYFHQSSGREFRSPWGARIANGQVPEGFRNGMVLVRP